MKRYIPIIMLSGLGLVAADALVGCPDRHAPKRYEGTCAENLAEEFESECFEEGTFRGKNLTWIVNERRVKCPGITDRWYCVDDGFLGYKMIVEETKLPNRNRFPGRNGSR